MCAGKLAWSIVLLTITLPSTALAASRTYFWGQLSGTEGISFHRQANNISAFHAVVPVHCAHIDGTTSIVSVSVSGEEVPHMLVERGKVEAEFTAWVDGLLGDANIAVIGRIRGNRGAFGVVVAASFPDSECSGAILFDRVRRGARLP